MFMEDLFRKINTVLLKALRNAGVCFAFLFLFAFIPANSVHADTEVSNGKLKYFWKSGGKFDIRGIDSAGQDVRTTFSDQGYETVLKIFDESTTGNTSYEGVEFLHDGDGAVDKNKTTHSKEVENLGVKIKRELKFSNDGKFVIVTYNLTNNAAGDKYVYLACGADVQIGNDDSATVNITSNGLSMQNKTTGYTFLLIAKGFDSEITRADSTWAGRYNSRQSNYFSTATENVTGTDSGITFSWQNRKIEAGKTLSLSCKLGVLPPNVINLSLLKNKSK